MIYMAVGLSKRNGPTFKTGALLIGANFIYRVDDATLQLSEVIQVSQLKVDQEEQKSLEDPVVEQEFKFIESALEVESSDSILLVFSDGSTWSLFENISCEMIARPASKVGEKFQSLIGGQLIQLSQNMVLNLRGDKASELFSYVDKKLSMIGRE